ncbi:MAG: hypothetical protein IKU58_08545 [Clostridia bacterium]|nr:hypothetical protein [Clostridia bacterium]
MTFVTADSCRTQLERLTRMLVSSFPGSTVYQHTDLVRVPHDVLNNKVDAVLLEAETEETGSLDLVRKLRRQKPGIPVFILSKTSNLCEAAVAAGADGYFVLPDSEQQLLDAIRSAKNKEHAS